MVQVEWSRDRAVEELDALFETGATREALSACRSLMAALPPSRVPADATLAEKARVLEEILREAIRRHTEGHNQVTEHVRAANELLGWTTRSAEEIRELLRGSSEFGNKTLSDLSKVDLTSVGVRYVLAGACFTKPLTSQRAVRNRRKKIAGYLAEAVEDVLHDDRGSKTSEPSSADTKSGKRWPWRVSRLSVAIVVGVAIMAGVIWAIAGTDNSNDGDDRRRIAELEARYDGNDPRGLDGGDTRCADDTEPPSALASSVMPPVIGPDGQVVGHIELRTSQSVRCPPMIWARVVWTINPDGQYTIPEGWTLHVVGHRPDTGSSFDEPETSSGTPILYGLGSMITTLQGCAYVEVHFSRGEERTSSARTACISGV